MDMPTPSDGYESSANLTKPTNPVSSELIALVVALVGICVLSFVCLRLMRGDGAPEDITDRLDAAVLRVMAADELGIDVETDAANNNLENILSILGSREQLDRSPTQNSLIQSAAKIKAAMDSGDRKSAVEELANFRSMINDAQAQQFRSPTHSSPEDVFIILLLGCGMGLLLALIYLFWSVNLSRRRVAVHEAETVSAMDEFAKARSAYELERGAATDLRQKLMEQSKSTKTLESRLKDLEAAKNEALNETTNLRRQVQQLTQMRSDLASANEQLKAEIKGSNQRNQEAAKALEAALDTARLADAKTKKLETEHGILEWSNVKLKSQVEELSNEIQKVKSELESEAKRFRDQLAALR
jgi:hypothetical protein